jgi:hypothetical protein
MSPFLSLCFLYVTIILLHFRSHSFLYSLLSRTIIVVCSAFFLMREEEEERNTKKKILTQLIFFFIHPPTPVRLLTRHIAISPHFPRENVVFIFELTLVSVYIMSLLLFGIPFKCCEWRERKRWKKFFFFIFSLGFYRFFLPFFFSFCGR